MLDLVVEASKCCSISSAQDPGNSSSCTMINCFKDPKLVFFEPTKCQTSSNSISFISFGTLGSGRLFPKSRIHRYTRVCFMLRILPSMRKEPLPIAYSKMHRAFFAAIFSLVRLSPRRKLHPQFLHLKRCLPPTTPLLTTFSESHFLHIAMILDHLYHQYH